MTEKLIKLLTECSIRKGGVNMIPTRAKPKTSPPGQGDKMSKYLEFRLLEQKPKTQVVGVMSRYAGIKLGTIKWYPRWRQYAFFPESDTIFNTECLNDIQAYIKKLMEERKK